MTRRGRTALVACAVLLLATSGCAARRPVPGAAAAAPLRVGTSGDYPPFSLRGADGAWDGFDVAVARAYADARGRRLELVPFRWPELAARLAAGEFDVAMSGITVRADRLLVGTMTVATARSEAVVLVRRDAVGAARVDRAGVRIAVNHGGHLERVARTRLRHATLVPVDDNRRLPELLAARAVDAVVTDTLEAATFPADAFVVAARLSRDRKAYWAAPGRETLAADLDAWLLASEHDGALGRLRDTWLAGANAPILAPELARVVDLAARRLMLMPAVAAAKRAAGTPIVDPAREAEVIARAVARARAAGLDGRAAARFARAQIDAARAVQGAARPASAPAHGAPTLAALRPRIDALDEATVAALVAARTAAVRADHAALATTLRADADVDGFDEAHAGAIAAAIVALVASPAEQIGR
ncbi:MAG: transporter substrate-binding domain-containing protein [Deltaproteobacteria bacterium]|nr:transporter substrate-binding domain-containing protein [Deltaproteobacteria bacterium]